MQLGLGLHRRFSTLARILARRWRQRRHIVLATRAAERLHIGSGPLVRPGWTNVDMQSFPGVDVVLDVRHGLPFRAVKHIYAEHFLEHLTYDEGLAFLKACRAVLVEDGILRLSTPNLDWVWMTQYRVPGGLAEGFAINKAFHGWGHHFLYNPATLTSTLQLAGFSEIRFCKYGESDNEVLRNLERHCPDPDYDGLAHVVIIEASGRARRGVALPDAAADYETAVHG